MFDLGVGDSLVGVTKFCVHPADGVREIEKVGGTKTPKIERVAELAPDLVLRVGASPTSAPLQEWLLHQSAESLRKNDDVLPIDHFPEADLRGFDGTQVRYAIGKGTFRPWQPYQKRFDLKLGRKQGGRSSLRDATLCISSPSSAQTHRRTRRLCYARSLRKRH